MLQENASVVCHAPRRTKQQTKVTRLRVSRDYRVKLCKGAFPFKCRHNCFVRIWANGLSLDANADGMQVSSFGDHKAKRNPRAKNNRGDKENVSDSFAHLA